MKMGLWSRVSLVAMAVAAAGLAGCGDGKAEAPEKAAKTAAVLELSAGDVATVRSGALANLLPVTGPLQAFNQTTVQARVPSDVGAVLVREGEQVARGQLLARLGTQDLEARLKQAEAQLASARVDAQLATAVLERNRQLYEKHYFSEIDFQRSTGEANARAEAVRAQEALVAIARKALADANVTAPMSGIIAKRYVEPGSSVGMDARLFDIVDLADLEMAAAVPAPDIPRVKVGQSVVLTVDGFGDQRFDGQVVRINPVAEAGTRAFSVYIRLKNPGRQLKGGMYARGTIGSGSGEQTLVMPKAAVRQEQGGAAYVMTLENGTLQRHEVTLGASDDRAGEVAVLSGLKAGDVVVTARLGDQAVNKPAQLMTTGE